MAEAIQFKEAIDYLAGKVNLPTARYDDLRHGAHVRAFAVSGVTRDDMLTDFRTAIEAARRGEATFDDFRKTFDDIVDRTGWQFNARGQTEEARRDWRARVIYRTNMQTSYMAGRYAQMVDPDVLRFRPFWEYVHSGALHPRKMHLSWNGQVWDAGNPIWNVIYPPNGWGCGCWVRALSRRQLAARGKDGPDPDPDLAPYTEPDPRTGDTVTRYPGIGRGWEYNVGREWLDGVVPKELHQPLPPPTDLPPADLPPMPAPRAAAASDLLDGDLEPIDYVRAFLEPFGVEPGGTAVYRDKSGGVIGVSQALFEARDPTGTVLGFKGDKRGRGKFARLIALGITDPDEIWVDWAQVTSGLVLRRSYLRRTVVAGRPVFVRFEWTKAGWSAITGFDTTDSYMKRHRRGALLYRRRD